MRPLVLMLVPLFVGCGSDCAEGTVEQDGNCVAVESDTDTDTDTDADSDTDTDTDTDADTDTDTDTDTDPPDYTVCADGVAPYPDIQAAIDAGEDGIIYVCAGTYPGFSVESVEAEVRGEDEASVIIVGTDGPGVTVEGGTLRLSHVTISGTAMTGVSVPGIDAQYGTLDFHDARLVGFAESGRTGTAIRLRSSNVELDQLVFEDNSMGGTLLEVSDGGNFSLRHSVFADNTGSTDHAAVMLLDLEATSVEVSNNLFYGNTTSGDLVSVRTRSSEPMTVTNNTWYGNTATTIVTLNSGVTFASNIVASNTGDGVSGASTTVDYNLVWGNSGERFTGGATGTGNIEADPMFTDAAGGDFTLDAGSPAMDAGDPTSGQNDVDATRNDMGAFGGPYGFWEP